MGDSLGESMEGDLWRGIKWSRALVGPLVGPLLTGGKTLYDY